MKSTTARRWRSSDDTCTEKIFQHHMWHAASLRHNLLTRHLAIKGHLLHKLVRVGHGLDISCHTHEAVALQKLFNQPAQKTKHKQRTEQTMAQTKEDYTNSRSPMFCFIQGTPNPWHFVLSNAALQGCAAWKPSSNAELGTCTKQWCHSCKQLQFKDRHRKS